MTADADNAKLPVTLVTGFLGSGKTTLINAVLRVPAFADSVVVVNEFGAVGVDHLLVTDARDNVVLLDSGCLCCAADGSLRDTLIDLFMRRSAGTLPPFRRVIVETSGLANPGPLLATLVSDSAVSAHFSLGLVLCMVDGVHGESTLAQYGEAVRQVALADRLAVSKTDLASTQQLESLRTSLRTINARAHLTTWTPGQDPAKLFADLPVAAPARAIGLLSGGAVRPQYAGEEGATHGTRFASVASVELDIEPVLHWQDYADWTADMRRRFGARLLRCKGLLAIESDARPWVVQCVQGHFSPPRKLEAWPEGVAHGFLVCIGEGIAADELRGSLTLLLGGRMNQAGLPEVQA